MCAHHTLELYFHLYSRFIYDRIYAFGRQLCLYTCNIISYIVKLNTNMAIILANIYKLLKFQSE